MSWRAAHSPDDDVVEIAASLERITSRLGIPSARTMSTIANCWPKVVGEVVAAHAQPVALRDGVLVVRVDAPQWRTELKWMAGQVADRLNAEIGSDVVEQLKISV